MENVPAVYLSFLNLAPTGDEETFQRFMNWNTEVYFPLLMKITGITRIDVYITMKRNPQYPMAGAIHHYENIMAYQASSKAPERKAVIEEVNIWNKRGIREGVWSAAYELVNSFRPGTVSIVNRDTRIDGAPIVHFEAYSMTLEEHEKYNRWFTEYGARVFIPLFMKNLGLKGHDYYKHSGLTPTLEAKEKDYPPYFSVLYFEDMKAFERFEESTEQRSFQSALRNIFPLGLNYKWYVQYQLLKSFRK